VSENWTPALANITQSVSVSEQSVEQLKQLSVLWNSHGSSAARFTKPLQGNYEVCPVNPLCFVLPFFKKKSMC
jgi:hypothetical protein